jgi:antitoxin ChpS
MLQKSNQKKFKQKLWSTKLTLIDRDSLISPITKPNYQLEELLANCDSKAKLPKEDQPWLKLASVGNEIL